MLSRALASLVFLASLMPGPAEVRASNKPDAAKPSPKAQPILAKGLIHGPGAARLPPGSILTVELRDISRQDAPSRLVARRVYRNVRKLPATFELRGSRSGLNPKRQRLSLSVSVRLANDNREAVGDYISESNNVIRKLGGSSLVRVTRLEHCQAPNARGFCTARVR
ncbi:MAG: YbaY family lipoprotein [Deltaproteobacteria bacterium]|jgi:uncharacterized lipoprotein YbaY|nr:YbaY family lipoprotein [Deltaproteobacteria bacterium]